ncbi:MAG: ROK family protein [Cytophagales bacterium]|nr:ROK family protein [Cytophagales bacterium]
MKIGVDLGGTNIRAGLIDGDKIVRSKALPLANKHDLNDTLEQLKSIIHSVHNSDITGIGVGVPSVVDLRHGIVYDVVNIPSWKEVPLRDILFEEFGVPIFINNDVNCFVLGEKYFGFGRNHENFVGVAIGTGIGAGIIINDRLYNGANCGAGEIGYLPFIDQDFEYYCSSNFFDKIHHTDAHQTFLEAKNKEPKALNLWNEFGSYLGIALRSIVYAYDPEAIILGGSISKALPFFKEHMYKSMNDTYFSKSMEKLKIYISEIELVSMLGAAAQVDQYLETIAS